MKQQLQGFYKTFGNRGIMFLIFSFSVVINTILSLKMNIISISPDEFGVAGVSAYMAGYDWSGTMSPMGYYYGFVQSIIYTPLFSLFENPYALYKAMLVVNGIAVSFIPVAAYDLSRRIGVDLIWKRLVITLCSGFYATYIAHSKFIWNETAASVLPWMIVWILFITRDIERPVIKSLFSWLAALFTVLLYCAHPRLIGIVAAVVITVISAQILTKKKYVYPLSFFSGIIVLGGVALYSEFLIRQNVWLGTVENNTIGGSVSRLEGLFSFEKFTDFISTAIGHLFYFFFSTWGIGAFALVGFCVIIVSYIYRKRKKLEQIYKDSFVVFGIFAFLSVGSMFGVSVLFKFNSTMLDKAMDIAVFGRYMDSVIPLAVMFGLCWLLMYDISLSQVFSSLMTLLISVSLFFFMTYPLIKNAGTYRISPILSLMPLRIGEDFTKAMTSQSFVIISSAVTIAAILVLIVISCGKKYKQQIISVIFTAAFSYSAIFVSLTYIPLRAEESLKDNATSMAVSQLIYNDTSSPVVVTYKQKTRTYTLLQFLNPKTVVRAVRQISEIPENCILIADKSVDFEFKKDLVILGSYKTIVAYAYGEKAQAYILSKTIQIE